MRLFLAINLPAVVRRELYLATGALRETVPEIAWVPEERLHLTLKFLGEQPESRVDELTAALAGVASRNPELLMKLHGLGAFPNFRRARLVWMGVAPEPRLELLHHDVEVACERMGFEIDARPFRPHLTLGRMKQPLDDARARQLSRASKQTTYETDFLVRSIDLMYSVLQPAGPQYTTLVSAALASG